MFESTKIAVIGLGYVGLPLAAEFGKKYTTVGFDINSERVGELRAGRDSTGEVEPADLEAASRLSFTSDIEDLRQCNVYIVAVPTPIDSSRRPNLGPLISASQVVGQVITSGDVVVYESTVYPGATEEDCLPVVERVSGLTYNKDFFAGYSPERINPGDKQNTLTKILKVTSGSTPEIADFVDSLYRSIIPAGTFRASSIKVAEAAKVIENTQRDVNIALINEFSIIFSHLGIDTAEVIEAASTKWNFMRLMPGLVGGHCIGVDPYYLMHKSEAVGHIPDIIRVSRVINNGMARNAASRLVRTMVKKGLQVKGSRALVLGVTFKENCPDTRNTKVVDLVSAMSDWGIECDIYDPWADPQQIKEEYGLSLKEPHGLYDALVLAVPHTEFRQAGAETLKRHLTPEGAFFDLKSVFGCDDSDLRL
ncbi:UDP-glucose dehydrogenase [Rubellimicrobium mesophilum DSM 19309]|uniref:UDP-glucose dehydrogenase n=1 Tax=Rubellimicrobium mesophilum DSM 19309 TaxID=442562 RepID=A0A017HQX8_9RHOB|nr:nucleotide sugar dehydrogenase [Rubellimicrobium mesophilum]EYD76791.1 UDP-glucose dehydrogenase [Rubellimicrobium mesophilum DSM 19309]